MSTNPFEVDSVSEAVSNNYPGPPVDRRSQNVPFVSSSVDPENAAAEKEPDRPPPSSSSTYDHMAKKLLEDNFILTALEFHAELLESGRELRRLRDYFSNPVHFESALTSNRAEVLPSGLARTSSAATLDSLDYTRYSDDGDRQADDRVAVLEFELRKAKDTIRSLREQLTVASESRTLTRDGESNDTLTHAFTGAINSARTDSAEGRYSWVNVPLKPHEQRALNFLVHEFLLQNGRKLTAVAFSDEVDDQDFEDWDDVGLNVPRPPDLHVMYRDYCYRVPGFIQRKDAACSVNMTTEETAFFEQDVCGQAELLNKLNDENGNLLQRNQQLEEELDRLSIQVNELQRNLNAPTTTLPGSSATTPSLAVDKDASEDDPKWTTPSSDQAINSCDRNVPNWLKEKVVSMTAAGREVLQQPKVTRIVSSNEELVDVLAVALPRIIPNVLLNKREELIDPLLNVAALHSNAKVRDQLLATYFGLIKRPDEEQRQLLVSGCIAYVKGVGAIRAETELLPQCWEKMTHKHVEQRVLVAETCGGIIPYLPPSVGSSLILSMLQQMLAEDKSELVREAVVRSLAILCIFIEDRDKFNQVLDLAQKAVSDQSEQVVSPARSLFIPCLGFWSLELGQFQSALIGTFVKRIFQLTSATGVNKSANEQLLCNYFLSLRSLTTLLFWSVLRTGPYYDRVTGTKPEPSAEFESTRFPTPDGLLDDLTAFYTDRRELARGVGLYDEWTSREWYQTWDQFDFVVKEMFPQLVAALGKLDATLNKAVQAVIDYFRHFVIIFGRGFSVTKIRPLFSSTMALEPTGSYDLSGHPILHAALPAYATGVLGAHHTDADKKELKTFMKTAIVAIAQTNGPYVSVLVTFSELSVTYPDTELILSVLWDLITHKTTNVRLLCAMILCRLIRSITDVTCLRNKLVPALITLASDREMRIRASTVVGFGAVLEVGAAHEDIMEKVRMQLSGMLAETQSTDVTVQIIRTFAQVAPNLETKFRDEFVLQQMAILCARNNASPPGETKTAVATALLDAYSALSCCYLSHNVVVESFLPGLKGLLKDLDSERAKVAKSIIRDLENKIAAANSADRKPVLGPTEIAVDEMKVKMMTKFRDFKDKMDQHKESVPNLFKKK